jgi:DNA-directed RNA polymerase subunit RPC12/RpoP
VPQLSFSSTCFQRSTFTLSYLQCPNCGSDRIETRDIAQRTGGTLGGLAGAAGGVAGALRGARAGFAIGMAAGPAGGTLGTVIGVVLGGLGGGALGTEVGAIFGRVVDDRVLNNCRCTTCGHTFSGRRGASDGPWSSPDPASASSPFRPAGPSPADGPFYDDPEDPDLD